MREIFAKQRDLLLFVLYSVIFALLFVMLNAVLFRLANRISVLSVALTASAVTALAAVLFFRKVLLQKSALIAVLVFSAYFCAFSFVSIFTSVFIDRSLTYHIMFYIENSWGEGVTSDDISAIMRSGVYMRQRVDEMRNSGYIEIKGDNITLTVKGKTAAIIMRGLGQIYDLNGTYEQMLKEMSDNAEGAYKKFP
jgi:hypothetical protein